jgi:hypothetical protein
MIVNWIVNTNRSFTTASNLRISQPLCFHYGSSHIRCNGARDRRKRVQRE